MANFSNYKSAIFNGLAVALAGSVLMVSLLGLKLIGPKAISLDTEMIGGTILFLMLYLFLLFAIYFTTLVSGSNQKIFNWLESGVSRFSISYTPSSL